MRFDHEKLHVYQYAIEFVAWSSDLIAGRTAPGFLRDQLGRAATSVCLNIAEGNGKSSPRDRCRFFEIARGSALECAACLDVLVAIRVMDREKIDPGKTKLYAIVNMIVGLIQRSDGTVREADTEYLRAFGNKCEHDYEHDYDYEKDGSGSCGDETL